MTAGKVELGCYWTMPKGVFNEDVYGPDGKITPEAIEEFGLHADWYYQIPHSFYKSSFDNLLFEQLFKSYWTLILSSNWLEINWKEVTKQISDVNTKMRKFYSNPKLFKHEGKSGADFERGGGVAKKDSEVLSLVS